MDVGGATDGRDGFEEEAPLVHEPIQADIERQIWCDREEQHGDPRRRGARPPPRGAVRGRRSAGRCSARTRAPARRRVGRSAGGHRPRAARSSHRRWLRGSAGSAASGRRWEELLARWQQGSAAVGDQAWGATAEPWWATSRHRSPVRRKTFTAATVPPPSAADQVLVHGDPGRIAGHRHDLVGEDELQRARAAEQARTTNPTPRPSRAAFATPGGCTRRGRRAPTRPTSHPGPALRRRRRTHG